MDEVILGSKIDVLAISDCGISNLSMGLIISWSSHLSEISLTENPHLFDANQEECEQFIANLHTSTFIKLDDYKVFF